MGGSSTKKTALPTQRALIEVSEPEEEDLPAKKVGRTKKLVCSHLFLVNLLLLMSPFRRPQVPKADEFRILYVVLITL